MCISGGYMPGVNVRLKKTASVTLDPLLFQQARDAGINISAALAAALKKESDDTGAEHWKRENRARLQELNSITDEHGLLSDEYRTF